MATFDYTSRDYLSIRQDLINRASRVLPEWNGNDASEFANVFVDLWAYIGDVLHYYVDRAASEAFLETATQKDSVLAIANLLDYIPAGVRSSRGFVNVRLNSFPTGETSYSIPQYTSFVGTGTDGKNYRFYNPDSSSAMTSVGATVSIALIQGKIVNNSQIGTSSGLANQKFRLPDPSVDIDSITIQVFEGPLSGGVPTAVEYQYVPQLVTASFIEKVFTARVASDGYTEILFGNGFNGKIPENNVAIIASYRTSDGSMGNLPANAIKFIEGSPSSYTSVISSSVFNGGADAESIDSIKNNVSRLYRTQDRAVSLQDYKDLTLQVPGVSKATAVHSAGGSFTISTSSIASSLVTFNTTTNHNFVVGQKVTISGVTGATSHNGTNLTIDEIVSTTSFRISTSRYGTTPTGSGTGGTATASSQVIIYPVVYQNTYPPVPVSSSVVLEIPTSIVESVESYFSTRSMLGVTARVIDPLNIGSPAIDKYVSYTPVYIRIKLYIRDNYVQSWVRDQVDQAVRSLLSFDNVYFNQRLTIGEVYRAILSVEGVDYAELYNLNGSYSGTDSVATVTNVQASTTRLLCFTDDLSGNLAVSFAPIVGGITGSN